MCAYKNIHFKTKILKEHTDFHSYTLGLIAVYSVYTIQ